MRQSHYERSRDNEALLVEYYGNSIFLSSPVSSESSLIRWNAATCIAICIVSSLIVTSVFKLPFFEVTQTPALKASALHRGRLPLFMLAPEMGLEHRLDCHGYLIN